MAEITLQDIQGILDVHGRMMRQEMAAMEERLRAEIKASERRLRVEIKAEVRREVRRALRPIERRLDRIERILNIHQSAHRIYERRFRAMAKAATA